MDPARKAVSPALAAANRQLYQLRQQLCPLEQNGRQPAVSQPILERDNEPSPTGPLGSLPEHLGWGSRQLTAVLRRHRYSTSKTAVPEPNQSSGSIHRQIRKTVSSTPEPEEQRPDWVKLYPDIGLGLLRQGQAAAGRLWLMLRYLDDTGQGALRIVDLRQQLTAKTSEHRLCGKRQMRNLIKAGEGLFWTKENGRLWLHSAARVAAALGVVRLTGRPVALPLSAVLAGIGPFKAHLYAAFHSGRIKETENGPKARPIARQTLTEISGVGRSSQQNYEVAAGVKVQVNFAVGERTGNRSDRGLARRQERAWRQGRALFKLKDYRGRQGRKGNTYLCWQLPNSYQGGHDFRPRGRQRKINRKLRDLVNKRAPGNGEGLVEDPKPEKVYYTCGLRAARAYNQEPEKDRYWQQRRAKNGRFVTWQQFGDLP